MTPREGYRSMGARLLINYAAAHPENIVWTPENGWRTPESLSEQALGEVEK